MEGWKGQGVELRSTQDSSIERLAASMKMHIYMWRCQIIVFIDLLTTWYSRLVLKSSPSFTIFSEWVVKLWPLNHTFRFAMKSEEALFWLDQTYSQDRIFKLMPRQLLVTWFLFDASPVSQTKRLLLSVIHSCFMLIAFSRNLWPTRSPISARFAASILRQRPTKSLYSYVIAESSIIF